MIRRALVNVMFRLTDERDSINHDFEFERNYKLTDNRVRSTKVQQ